MDNQALHVMTIANSIIGVSIIAMPYCFKQCGIVLSIVILIVSSVISRLSCHLLLKSAIMARRRTFEFLAFHAFGPLGKFIVEIGLIGFLLGTCIAFFVVMGDLGPAIVTKMTGTRATDTLRTSILIALALFCVLPLGLLRNIDSLSSVCTATIGFYFCLVLKIIVQSIPHIFSGDWIHKVELWRPAGFLQCLPIFSMALFCQTQIFEIYQAIPNPSLEKMNGLIRMAVNICTSVYIFVGIFGYIAFSSQTFTGNILMSFPTSLMSEVIKIGFVLSVAFSFPLVIFPCRASLYSLLYKRLQTYSLHDGADKYIPEGRFKALTFMIVFVSLVTGVMIPNIELVLGLVGSTIGIMICILFPAMCFICISTKNTNERILAQLMLFIGVIVMVLGTYANLYAMEEMGTTSVIEKVIDREPEILQIIQNDPALKVIAVPGPAVPITSKSPIEWVPNKEVPNPPVIKEVRHEPPQPEEPAEIPVVPEIKHTHEQQKEVAQKLAVVLENIEVSKEKFGNNKPKDLIVENPVGQSVNNASIKKDSENPVLQEPVNGELIKESKNIIKNVEIVDVPIYSKVNDNSENGKIIAVNKNIQDGSLDEKTPLKNSEHMEINLNKAKEQEIGNTINGKKADEVAKEAIEKEEKELLEQEKEKIIEEEQKNLDLIKSLEKQNKEQKQIVEEKKKILKEIKLAQEAMEQQNQQNELDIVKQHKLKAVLQIQETAQKAIEKLSGSDKENGEQLPNHNKVNLNQNNEQPQKPNLIKTETTEKELNLEIIKHNNDNNKEQANLNIKVKENNQQDNPVLPNKLKPNEINHRNVNNNLDNLVPLPIALSGNFSDIYKKIVANKNSPTIDVKNVIPDRPNVVNTNMKLEDTKKVVPIENNEKPSDVNKQPTNDLHKKDQMNLFDVLKTRTEKQDNIISHREIRSVDETNYLPLAIEVEEFDKKDPEMKMIDKNKIVIVDETKDSILEHSKDSCVKDQNNVKIEKETEIKSTEAPLIRMITKLSEPELVSFKAPDVDTLNIDYILKPLKRDLKSYKSTKRK